MPIYAYRCTTCGNAQDVLRKISDPPLTVCPACGAPTFVKQVTAAGFQLKGSGWYVTDFRDGGKKAKSDEGAVKGDNSVDKGGEKSAEKGGDKGAGNVADASGAGGASAKASDTASAPAPSAAAPAPAPASTPAATPAPAPKPGKGGT
jgi:putative FmdB family regulatory protein